MSTEKYRPTTEQLAEQIDKGTRETEHALVSTPETRERVRETLEMLRSEGI
jgi:hypothetical protein